MAGWTLKSPGLSALTVKLTFWEDSFAGPGEMAVAQPRTDCAGVFELRAGSAPAVKLGASLTAVTVIVKVRGAGVGAAVGGAAVVDRGDGDGGEAVGVGGGGVGERSVGGDGRLDGEEAGVVVADGEGDVLRGLVRGSGRDRGRAAGD